MNKLSWILVVAMLFCACAQNAPKDSTDSQTGKVTGTGEISPEEMKQYIDGNTNSIIIDVRKPEAFARQTIKGAVNFPLENLEENLKNIPRGTALFFT